VATVAMLERPVLVLNPRSDDRFVTWARDLVQGGIATPADLQRRLCERYPRAVVRLRELSGEAVAVWYVYRDGRWASRKTVERKGSTANGEPEG
jgi:hypothetical protein